MRTFVLIAGSWHGAWCWERVVTRLTDAGHRVLTPELPGTGADQAAASSATLESWASFVANVITGEAAVTLVGHSRGGIVISRAAELVPQAIERLVYISAYLLPAGRTLAQEARADHDSLVPSNMIPAESGHTCTLRTEVIREAFYGDCDAATAADAQARLTPEPLKPLVTPVKITPQGFGRVPRAYVECTRDRTVTLAAQRRMQAALPCDRVITLESDHSPFLSHPEELARALSAL